MQILVKKQTTFGMTHPLAVYHNGRKIGRLFNNIPLVVEVEVGDQLIFKEHCFALPTKVTVTETTQEITIQTTNRFRYLFRASMLLFLIFSVVNFWFDSWTWFIGGEVLAFVLISQVLRAISYRCVTDHEDWFKHQSYG